MLKKGSQDGVSKWIVMNARLWWPSRNKLNFNNVDIKMGFDTKIFEFLKVDFMNKPRDNNNSW